MTIRRVGGGFTHSPMDRHPLYGPSGAPQTGWYDKPGIRSTRLSSERPFEVEVALDVLRDEHASDDEIAVATAFLEDHAQPSRPRRLPIDEWAGASRDDEGRRFARLGLDLLGFAAVLIAVLAITALIVGFAPEVAW